jgi:hypothetical protein
MTMQLDETVAFITWINQHDPRVQVTKGARDIWAHSLAPVTYDEARQAVLEHYRANDSETPNPGTIRKRALAIRGSREAGQRAIDGPAEPVKHPLSWRKRNPELWDQLFEQGRREGNEERRRATEARKAGSGEDDHADWMAA